MTTQRGLARERSLLEEVVVLGKADWATIGLVMALTPETGVTDYSMNRQMALGVIAEALAKRLMVPGSIEEGEFVPWESDLAESFWRITTDFVENWDNDNPEAEEVVWLLNTPRGDELAESVLAREAPM